MKLNFKTIALGIAVTTISVAGLSSCNDNNKTGWEFAPNMYNSRAYEPLTQWRKNTINADGKNMRLPVAGTIARGTAYINPSDSVKTYFLEDGIGMDSITTAEKMLHNPIELSDETLEEGKVLFERNCQHCHGEQGKGDGPVAEKYKGVPNYTVEPYKSLNDGHIYYVITNGIRRMWPHKSQVTPEERWKIVHYVHKLQAGS